MGNFDGTNVLITGAATGIGYCTAEEFAAAGARLVLSDIDADALGRSAEALRSKHGANILTYVLDVADKAAVDAMAGDVLGKLGHLDILIDNAGIAHNGPLADTTLETWRRLVEVNLFGALNHVYAFLPSMRERRDGHIVNISSGQAFFRLPSWGAYAAVKAALGIFSEILHFELGRVGIRVTTVYPYMVNTKFYRAIQPDTLTGKWSMKLLPYYSDTPERVGRIVFDAVRRDKRVEMVSVFNDIGFYTQLAPPVAAMVSRVTSWLLTSEGR